MNGRKALQWIGGLLFAASLAVVIWNEWLRKHPPFLQAGVVDSEAWMVAWRLMEIAPTIAVISLLLVALSFRRDDVSPERWGMLTGGSVLLLYSAWTLFESLRPRIVVYTPFTSVQPAPPQPELWTGLGVAALGGLMLVALGLRKQDTL